MPVGPAVNTRMRISISIPVSSWWCKQINSMVCLVRTRTRISNTSSSCVTRLSSKTSHLRASGSAYFPSPSRGRRSSGATRKMKLSRRGTNVPRCSSSNSSPWTKPMPWGDEFRTSSKAPWKPFPRRGRGCGTTSKHARTTGLRAG
jgi:hypothetical protein